MGGETGFLGCMRFLEIGTERIDVLPQSSNFGVVNGTCSVQDRCVCVCACAVTSVSSGLVTDAHLCSPGQFQTLSVRRQLARWQICFVLHNCKNSLIALLTGLELRCACPSRGAAASSCLTSGRSPRVPHVISTCFRQVRPEPVRARRRLLAGLHHLHVQL